MKKLSFILVAVLSIAAFGCKKKGGGDCASAVRHSMDLSKADMQKMGTDDKMMQKMVDLGIQHCKDDKWSADAIKCMTDAQTMKDSQGCYDKLTADQQSKMNTAAMELMAPPSDMGSATPTEAGSAAPEAGSDSGSAAPEGSAAAGSGSAG